MTRKYTLKKLEKSIKNSHKVIEKAQKRCSRSGKDKSLLHQVCRLGAIIHKGALRDALGNRYTNAHTHGDRIILEEIGTYKYKEYENNVFYDKDNQLVNITGYKN